MENNILNTDNYTRLCVEDTEGKKIAEITSDKVISAPGYVVRLTPRHD